MDLETILRAVAFIVIALVVFAIIKKSLYVVQQGTVAVIKRWGKHSRVLPAGLHFRLLFGDSVQRRFSSQRTSLPLELRGDSGERLPVQLSAELELRGVTDPDVVSTLAYEVEQPLSHLHTVAAAEVRELLLPMSFEQLLDDTTLGGRIQHKLDEVARQCGYEIMAVRVTSIRPEESVHRAIIEGVRSEKAREMEAAQAKHDNALALDKANTTANVSKIEAETALARLEEEEGRIIGLAQRLLRSNVPAEQVSQIITALLNKAVINELAGNPGAKIVLLPPSLALDGELSALMELADQA